VTVLTGASPARRASTPAPTARVGMIGAGQLARMTQQAAIALGVELRVLTEDPEAPAVRAGATPVLGRADDPAGLDALAAGCDVVTFDHELVPAGLLAGLARRATVRPSPAAKAMAQDKLHARRTLRGAGLEVPPFAPCDGAAEVAAFAAEHGWPVVVKARSGGYDGRGVWRADDERDAARICREAEAAGVALLVEAHVDIAAELAVLVARTPSGARAAYPVLETHQRDGICIDVVAPAAVSADQAARATRMAVAIADGFDVAGVLAVELFLTGDRLLVNELALRPHNSGHLTIDACPASQFEQHLRALLDWPLGETGLLAPAAAMVNVLGPPDGSDPARRLTHALAVPGARVHLYAKAARPGRKLGHVTALGATADHALDRARAAAAALAGP
jgi:5-(carboxyamino)imidazole ribonucleotide synthase